MNKLRKHSVRVVSFVMAAIICLLMAGTPSQYKVSAKSKDTLEEEKANYQAEMKKLEKELSSLKSDVSKATEYKASLDALANTTMQSIATSEALAAELEQNIKTTEENIAAKEKEIDETFALFLERMRVAYEEGDASYLSIILGSENMADFLSRMDMVSSMLDYDKKLKEQLTAEKEELETKKLELSEAKAEQEQNLLDLESEKSRLEGLANEHASYISSLKADQATTQKYYDDAQAAWKEADRQLTELMKQQSDPPVQYQGTGIYQWPLPGYSYISSGFGHRVIFGRNDNHTGIDIPAPYGTPIVAADNGVVTLARSGGSYGNLVVINHGGNMSTAYAHMSRFGCTVGQSVKKGQVIGYVGSTGQSTGNHLHFEVRVNGVAVNPKNGYV